MVISVQGYNGKKSKSTQTACCIAGMLALAKGQKTLLLQLTKKDINNVENTFLGTDSVSIFKDLSLANTCIDSLLRSVQSTRMSVDDFDQNVTPLIRNVKNLLDITENTNDVNFDLTLLDREDDFVNIVESAKDIYENIVLLAMENDCETLEMINENADLSIYCITQGHKKTGHAYGKKIIYLVTDYEPSSTITLKAIRKQYKEGGIMAPVNVYKLTRNVSVRDASINGTLLRFIRDNKSCREYDRNYAWYQDMETICNLISDAPMDEISATEWEVIETRIRINGELGKELKIRDREPSNLVAVDEAEGKRIPEEEKIAPEGPDNPVPESNFATEMEPEDQEAEEEMLQDILTEAVTQIKNPKTVSDVVVKPEEEQSEKPEMRYRAALNLKKGPKLRKIQERNALERQVNQESNEKKAPPVEKPAREKAEEERIIPEKHKPHKPEADSLSELEYEQEKEPEAEILSEETGTVPDEHEADIKVTATKEEKTILTKSVQDETAYEPDTDAVSDNKQDIEEVKENDDTEEQKIEYEPEEDIQKSLVAEMEPDEDADEGADEDERWPDEDLEEEYLPESVDLEDLMREQDSTKQKNPVQEQKQMQMHRANSNRTRPEKKPPQKETESQKKYHAFIDRAKAKGKTHLASMSYEEWVEFTEMNS